MRTWNLSWEQPLYPVLAADARLSEVDFCDDQIWEVRLDGDPPALALYTTYGLRARGMRLFPLFTEHGNTVHAPQAFATGVRVQRLYPNLATLLFSPFEGIDVVHEAWVVDSHTLSGRLQVHNSGSRSRQVRLEWAALLTPTQGERMAPCRIDGVEVLCGHTANLWPVLYVTGGLAVVASPLPAFVAELTLLPGQAQTFHWAHVALCDADAAFEHARQTIARPWEAEIARIEQQNAAQVQVHTGDQALDATLAMAQNAALSLLHRHPNGALPHPFFVASRRPEHGYSLAGTGVDYPPAWRGSTPLAAWHLAQTLLFSAPQAIAGWVENFLSAQNPDGAVDMQPGPAGQRTHILALPILVSLAWQVFQVTQDRAWLERIFPALLAFFQHWFTAHHDADGDGVPEWEHPLQLEAGEHPAFTPWENWTQGLDVQVVEDPALGAMLIHAAQALMTMARALHTSAPLPALQAIADNLFNAIQMAWEPQRGFRAWDRDTHHSPTGTLLGQYRTQSEVSLRQQWDSPQRLLLHLTAPETSPGRGEVFIQGTGAGGQARIEHLSLPASHWLDGKATLTSQETYRAVEHITLQGLPPDGTLLVSTADFDFECLTHFLPLWAGVPDEQQAATLHNLLTDPDGYDQPYGLPFCPAPPVEEARDACLRVWWPWVGLVIEGLLRYGYRDTAADLYLRALRGTIRILQQEHTFRQSFHAGDGRGMGERGALSGIPPLRLFLELAGIRLQSPWEVAILERNALPWPVTIWWKGLTVRREEDSTQITFPSGQVVQVEEPFQGRVRARSPHPRPFDRQS